MSSVTILSTASDRIAWTVVCHLTDLVPERGAAALVGGEQIALFRLHAAPAAELHDAALLETAPTSSVGGGSTRPDVVLAVQQLDPFSGAHVMARGIVGSRGDAPTVASPMYKQVFDLRTGLCLDAVGREPQHLRTWPVIVEGGLVLVGTVLDTPGHGVSPPERTTS